jgi:lipopolysaccharide transport system permease protein
LVSSGWDHHVDLVTSLTIKDIKVRYKRTYLGYAWSLLNPLVYAVTYWIAFKAILNVRIEGYFVFLLAGLFPWQWLANSMMLAPNAFLVNSPLVKKIYFPRHLLVVSSVLTEGLHFALCVPMLALLVILFNRGHVTWSWVWGVPMLLLLQGVTIYGIALAVASLNVFFRDLERILALAMTVLFFLTPVIFERTMVPPLFQPLINFNPFTPLVVGWRALFLGGAVDWNAAGHAAVFASIAVIVGHLVFRRLQWKFAEAL